jgi:hypothetical protein
MVQAFAALLIILVSCWESNGSNFQESNVIFASVEQNFLASIVEAQLQSSLEIKIGDITIERFFNMINSTFTLIFAFELLVNLYAHWLRDFLSNSWSCFDAIVVTLSLITLGPLDLPISVLRALRVLRLFGRFRSLKRILAALSASIIPVLNAFLIMLIVAMICDCRSHEHQFAT